MNQPQRHEETSSTTMPWIVGISSYYVISRLIPKSWNILVRAEQETIWGGFVEGIGSVRNMLGVVGGIAGGLLTNMLLSNNQEVGSSNVCDRPEDNRAESATKSIADAETSATFAERLAKSRLNDMRNVR